VQRDFEIEMKLAQTNLIIVGVLAANLVVLWCFAHHYEFHTGMNGAIIWRCNNFTGKAEHSSFGESQWVAVSSQKVAVSSEKTFVPPGPDEIIKPAPSSGTNTPDIISFEEARPK
jgi:hypothetical protein